MPTIRALADAGARVVVTAHLGRPKGAPDPAYSLAPGRRPPRRAARAATSPSPPTRWATAPAPSVDGLQDGQVAVLENVRFNAGETSKDDAERGAFADQLAALADAFVSDGFGVVHRKQASVYDVAQRLPHAMGGLVADRDRGAAAASPRTPSGPTWSSSAAPRSPTSSASSTTCSARPTSC